MCDSDLSANREKTPVEMEPKSMRIKKKPQRFGEAGILELSDEADMENSFERMLSDDSTDDYVAEVEDPKRRVVHTIRTAKKKKTEENIENIDVDNFDQEFDFLISQTTHGQTDGNTDSNDEDLNGILVMEKTSTGTNSKSVNDHKEHETLSSRSNDDLNNKLLLEILVRVKVIEQSLMKSGALITTDDVDKGSSFEEYHTFIKSNRLPIKNIEDMTTFEQNLCDPEFRKVSVKMLSTFSGVRRIKGNHTKMLRAVIALIIDRYFMAGFSYSGKSVKGQRKTPLKSYENILSLLYSVANKIDKNYEKEDFEADLKDKILKYAGDVLKKGEKRRTPSTSSTDGTDSSKLHKNIPKTNVAENKAPESDQPSSSQLAHEHSMTGNGLNDYVHTETNPVKNAYKTSYAAKQIEMRLQHPMNMSENLSLGRTLGNPLNGDEFDLYPEMYGTCYSLDQKRFMLNNSRPVMGYHTMFQPSMSRAERMTIMARKQNNEQMLDR